jgi:hypothetical protein
MKLLFFIIPALISFHLTSCSTETYNRSYRFADDGLIYTRGGEELFTGVVIDTSDIIISFEVEKGIKNGAFITFYLNGNYEKYGLIKDNKNEGEWKYFYPNGQVESIGNFSNNEPHGRWTLYYPDGKVKMDGQYLYGGQHGAWLYYDKNGKLINILFYDCGFLQDMLRNI